MEQIDDTNQPLDYSEESYVDPAERSPRPTAFKWGLYGGLASIAVGLILHLTGLTDFSERGGGIVSQIASYAIWIGTIVLAIRAHRDEDLGGYITFGRSFITGLWTGLMYALITAVWSYIFLTFIAPDALDQIRETAYAQMEARGMDDAQMEAAEGMMGTFTSPGFISLTAFFVTALFSLIISLIAGAILKRNHPMAA